MRYLIVFIFFLGQFSFASAQDKGDYQQMYLKGKNLYKAERYQEAMEIFRQLASPQKGNSFEEYSSFYYALSALKAGKNDVGKAMLKQIQHKYVGWDKQEEVSYWLINAHLRENDYEQALREYQKLRGKKVKADAEGMINNHLMQNAEVSEMKQLLTQFPKAEFLGKTLAYKMARQPLNEEDKEYLKKLAAIYNLDKEAVVPVEVAKSEFKEEYNVAVMLPFLLQDVKPQKNLHDYFFVMDLYEGIKLAQEELAKEGIKINVYAYDTKRDSATTASILKKDEMKKMDLIVGPLFPKPVELVQNYALKHGVNMVNPLSVNSELIQNNPYAFLYKPSIETQSKKAAEFASQNFLNKNVAIIYGPKERDSVMAHSYKKAVQNKGFQVKIMSKIPAGSEKEIRRLLSKDDARGANLGHVFVASEEEVIVANSISAVMGRGDKLPLVGQESWLSKSFVSYEQMERMGAYFLAPEYINYNSEYMPTFKQMYIDEVHALPTKYAYLGFDLMMFFGKMMNQYGTHFQNSFDKAPFQKGLICTGFSYVGGNDNQCVPVVTFKNSALEVVFQ